MMSLSKMFGTLSIWHCESVASSSPGQATAWPGAIIWTSPDGCWKPRNRPGTVGIGSSAWSMRVKEPSSCSERIQPAMKRHQHKRSYLAVKELGICRVSNSWCTVRDAGDGHRRRQVEAEHERVELGDRAAE
jgi:hypothetical protein